MVGHQDTGGPASSSNLPTTAVQQQRTIVPRPIPKAEATNPRDFQIGQIDRRYSPAKTDDANGTTLVFQLQPSDPDFPFELRHGLACKLVVPKGFPGDAKPTLRVSNAEMARGYQVNVERGLDSLVNQHPHLTLLKLMNELDKNLETFLTAQKAETIKISFNASKPVGPTQPPAAPVIVPMPAAPAPREPAFSDKQKSEAKAKRESEVRQLEARMGKLPLFSKSADGTSFEVPLQIPKPTRLPPSLQSLRDVTLLVPILYDLEPCSIVIKSVDSRDSRNVEKSFARKARDQLQLSLMAHINALSQNMHVMAAETESDAVKEQVLAHASILAEKVVTGPPTPEAPPFPSSTEGKSHIVVIPRPPEWSAPDDDLSDDDDDSSEEYQSDEEPTDEDEDGGAPVPADAIEQTTTGPDLGISLSFPFLELYGIELLKLSLVSITLKCDRCKTPTDIKNLQPSQTKTESCAKCVNPLSIGYRSELMHSNAIRAGYLDLDGCTVADLLPSTFVPTCATCSTDYKAGAVSVRGESTLAVCRECHAKMSFKIPEVKFLRISAGSSTKDKGVPRKRPKENLGITAGQELPRRGRCQHYGKSYRWFRFSCCNKVYACDRCHDAEEAHPNEHANRMICGWCSREQIYRELRSCVVWLIADECV